MLGGMLIDRDAVTRAIEFLNEGMFYREANRRLYRAMLRLFERGDVIDVITVSEELKKTGEMEASGGFDYLGALVDAVPTAANLEYHRQHILRGNVTETWIGSCCCGPRGFRQRYIHARF